MPSLFSSWRPKLQIRLRRLSRLDGGHSTEEDEEVEEEEQRAAKRRLALLEGNNDFIIQSSPSGDAAGHQLRDAGGARRRAVRFCEDPLMVSSVRAHPAPLLSPPFPPPSSANPMLPSAPPGGMRMPQLPPMNSGGAENLQPPRPARNVAGGTQNRQFLPPQQMSRANVLLQQLRAREAAEEGEPAIDSDEGRERSRVLADGATSRASSIVGVFLEFQGETKRSALPPNVRSVEQLKNLFLRCFPSLSPAQVQSPGVKVYIQSAHSPHRLFYELEDISEVRDQSVLRLFEQLAPRSSTTTSPIPHRPPRSAAPLAEYFSEPEMVDWTPAEVAPRQMVSLRPASVQPQHLGGGVQRRKPPSVGMYETPDSWHSSSAYSSDSSTSGPYARSGSTTPVLISGRREDPTQRKVDSLERQLASLSELVHMALLPSPRDESAAEWKELNQLQAASCASSTMTESACSAASSTDPAGQQLRILLLGQLEAIRADLNALRRDAIRSASRGREMMERALDRVRELRGWSRAAQEELDQRKEACLGQLEGLQGALREFEAALENTRASVLNSTRRLRLDEVDELASRLGEIGREAVELKMGIPALQRDMEEAMRRSVERLGAEERFLREKVPLVDGCLRRCKTLANVMVTMKKLAMVQDERIIAPPTQRRNLPVRHISLHNFPSAPGNPRGDGNPHKGRGGGKTQQNGQYIPSHHPLDAILDELSGNESAADHYRLHKGTNEISASFTLRMPLQSSKGSSVHSARDLGKENNTN